MDKPITRSIQRDHYIIAQALWIAARELAKVPAPHTEISNIRDMHQILDTAFPHYRAIFEAEARGFPGKGGE